MLDTILYELSKVAWVLPIFLGIILLLSFIMYLVTKKFDIHKKSVMEMCIRDRCYTNKKS